MKYLEQMSSENYPDPNNPHNLRRVKFTTAKLLGDENCLKKNTYFFQ